MDTENDSTQTTATEESNVRTFKGVYDRQAEKLAKFFIEGLENGTSRWVKPWEPSSVPSECFNPSTGKAYRGGNQLALLCAEEELLQQGVITDANDHRWLTYKQASAVGAQVKKGQKGTMLITWKELDAPKDEATVEGEEARKKMMCQAFFVFHASQIDGLPPLEPSVPKPLEERLQEAQNLLDQSGAKFIHGGNEAYYMPSADIIKMPKMEQFKSPDLYFTTALHELGHWTGHESRLNRNFSFDRSNPDYAREELRAEMTSYAVSQRLGLAYDPSNHQAYVNSWIKLLKEDPREILRASNDVEKILTQLRVPELVVEPLPQVERKQEKAKETAKERPQQRPQQQRQRAVAQEMAR